MELEQIIPLVNARFSWAAGLPLSSAVLTEQGFAFVFEDADRRVEINLTPRLYPEGRLVIDAVNDLTIKVTVTRQSKSGAERDRSEEIEIPYAAWFGDSFM